MLKQYIIIPKKPKMSIGKVASQATHASYMALKYESFWTRKRWERTGQCVIVLQCKDSSQLMGIAKYFEQWNILHHIYIDEGFTEVNMGDATALATGIIRESDQWMFDTLKML